MKSKSSTRKSRARTSPARKPARTSPSRKPARTSPARKPTRKSPSRKSRARKSPARKPVCTSPSRKPARTSRARSKTITYMMKRHYEDDYDSDDEDNGPYLIGPAENEFEILNAKAELETKGLLNIPKKLLTQKQRKTIDSFLAYSEEDAITAWVSDGYDHENKVYRIINKALIGGYEDQLEEPYNQIYQIIKRIFSDPNQELKRDIVVYRGVKISKEKVVQLDSTQNKMLLPTTTDIEVANSFTNGHCCLLEITLKKGVRVINIDDEYENSIGEKEILVENGGKFVYNGERKFAHPWFDHPLTLYQLTYYPPPR